MKMSSALVARTLNQFEAQTIPANHPSRARLSELFGDHTFFLDGHGLHIVEPSGRNHRGALLASVVRLASWKDADRTTLQAHRPESTDVVVELGADDPDPAP
jgi:hypothetical protein